MTLRILSWHPISVSRVAIAAQVSKAVIADHLCTTLPTERARWYSTASEGAMPQQADIGSAPRARRGPDVERSLGAADRISPTRIVGMARRGAGGLTTRTRETQI